MKRHKKALILSLAYFPKFVGGAEVAIKEITDRLGEKYTFDMVTLRFNSDLEPFERVGNVNVYRVGYSKKNVTQENIPFIIKIIKIISPFIIFWKSFFLQRRNNYDFVWVMMANQAGFASLLFKFFFPKVPICLSIQEGDPPEYIKNKFRSFIFFYKKIFTCADSIQAISNFLAEFASEMAGGKKISVIPNGVNVNNFINIDKKNRSKIREKFSISDDDFLVFTASRLVEKNGVEYIIKSIEKLPPNYKLLIAGEGVLKQSLFTLVEKLNITNRVYFAGFIPQSDIPDFYAAADVFIRPSLSEGMGNVFLEAMAAHLPVLATNVGGIKDIIIDGYNGLVVETKNPEDIARKILIISKNDEMREFLADNGFKWVLYKYDWKNIAREMDVFFNLC